MKETAKYTYVSKNCLFCDETDVLNHPIIYKRNFKDAELNADVFSARRTTEHFHYNMAKCSKTGLLFSKEILDESALKDLYRGSLVTFNEHVALIKKDYWKPLAGFLKGKPKDKALDIGCSNGFFLEVLKDNGFTEVYGCEPSTEAKTIARDDIRDHIHTGFYEPGLYPENHFDLISCFQTLDHLSEPLEMLRNMRFNLKKGGNAYLIMHNTLALQAKLFGEKSPIIDVEHIYLFNKQNLSALCEKAGFRVIGVFDIKNSYPFSYWIRMSPLPLKKLWIALFKMIGIYHTELSLKAGNMGILLEK